MRRAAAPASDRPGAPRRASSDNDIPASPAASGQSGAGSYGAGLAATLSFAVKAQLTVSLLTAAVPVIAPAVAKGRGLDVRLVAFYFPIVYGAGFLFSFLIPKLLPRLGGAGLSLLCVGLGAAGIVLLLPAGILLTLAAPIAVGVAFGAVTPATSQVVSPYMTPRSAGLIMSIRHSAIPAGSMLAGVLMPAAVWLWGWRGLLEVGLAGAGVVALLLPGLRRLNGDAASTPAAALHPLDPVRRLWAMSGMPRILLALLTYVMMVVCLKGFFTVYLVKDLRFGLATAGLVYGVAQFAGMLGQIGCAIVSDRWVSPRAVLALNGALMTAAALLAASFTLRWPIPAILSAAFVLGFFAMGAVPVALGEIARRASPGEVGLLVSGGNLFIIAGGAIGPLVFGAAAAVFGYSGGLVTVALFTLGAAVAAAPLPFLRRRRRGPYSAN